MSILGLQQGINYITQDDRFLFENAVGNISNVPGIGNTNLGQVTTTATANLQANESVCFQMITATPPGIIFVQNQQPASFDFVVVTPAGVPIDLDPVTTPNTYRFQPSGTGTYNIVITPNAAIAANVPLLQFQVVAESTVTQFLDWSTLSCPLLDISEAEKERLISLGKPIPSVDITPVVALNSANNVPNAVRVSVRNAYISNKSPKTILVGMCRLGFTGVLTMGNVDTQFPTTGTVSLSQTAGNNLALTYTPTTVGTWSFTALLTINEAGQTISPGWIWTRNVPLWPGAYGTMSTNALQATFGQSSTAFPDAASIADEVTLKLASHVKMDKVKWDNLEDKLERLLSIFEASGRKGRATRDVADLLNRL